MSNVEISSFSFISPSTGWALGSSGNLYQTTNGGLVWSLVGLTVNLKIDFLDTVTGWAVGGTQGVKATTDGGQTWTDKNSNLPPEFSAFGVGFFDGTHGCIGGPINITSTASAFGGAIFYTANGGATWTKVYEKDNVEIFDVFALPSARLVWAVGADYNTAQPLVLTSGDGQSWTPVNMGAGIFGALEKVNFVDGSNGWAVGEQIDPVTLHSSGPLILTGNSWGKQNLPALNSNILLFGVSTVDSSTAYAVGNQGTILSFGCVVPGGTATDTPVAVTPDVTPTQVQTNTATVTETQTPGGTFSPTVSGTSTSTATITPTGVESGTPTTTVSITQTGTQTQTSTPGTCLTCGYAVVERDQADPVWADTQLDSTTKIDCSECTFQHQGCALMCLAMITGNDPVKLNSFLSGKKGAFSDTGGLILKDAIKYLGLSMKVTSFSACTLSNALCNGAQVIAEVPSPNSDTQSHYVVVFKGRTDCDFIILDPAFDKHLLSDYRFEDVKNIKIFTLTSQWLSLLSKLEICTQ